VIEANGEVFGDAPNVAAGVQAAAEPGSVLVTMNVQCQVAGLFVPEEQGARELKGVTDPIQLYRIVLLLFSLLPGSRLPGDRLGATASATTLFFSFDFIRLSARTLHLAFRCGDSRSLFRPCGCCEREAHAACCARGVGRHLTAGPA
jgi:hypothetical protein